ncbi:MAG: YggT family protein [Syntrophomonadaceae bacterium]|nr:YggT family protein [Syntrophomonadaceae bacterium]
MVAILFDTFTVPYVVNVAFEVLTWLVIARVILSWVRHDPRQTLIKFIYDVTEPIMAPFRRLVPSVGGIDFSPLLVILVIEMVRKLVVETLVTFMG